MIRESYQNLVNHLEQNLSHKTIMLRQSYTQYLPRNCDSNKLANRSKVLISFEIIHISKLIK